MTTTLHRSLERPSLAETARALVAGGRGILAADESIRTMSARLEAAGITADERSRRDYRELLLTAPGLSAYVTGVIWCEETLHQRLSDGRPFPVAARERGILAGIKVDTGTVPLAGTEGLITQGLDGLDARLAAYAETGAAFAKWRAVLDVRTLTPYVARANAHALARYALACQQHGIVPIVEPEVLAEGDHALSASALATRAILGPLFEELEAAGVDLTGIVLKPNFVTPGLGAPPASAEAVARATYDVLRGCVPEQVPGIAFLSGGHGTAEVCGFLATLNARGRLRWPLTFSFGRALVSTALTTWRGDRDRVPDAQRALLANCVSAATAARAAA